MTALNDYRLIATAVDRIFDCHKPVGDSTCAFPAGHDDDCATLPPAVTVCRLCRGRTHIETLAGWDATCPTCGGTGIAP